MIDLTISSSSETTIKTWIWWDRSNWIIMKHILSKFIVFVAEFSYTSSLSEIPKFKKSIRPSSQAHLFTINKNNLSNCIIMPTNFQSYPIFVSRPLIMQHQAIIWVANDNNIAIGACSNTCWTVLINWIKNTTVEERTLPGISIDLFVLTSKNLILLLVESILLNYLLLAQIRNY